MTALRTPLALLALLMALMAATRSGHAGPLPDASWALFFGAGYMLHGARRWAFPLLMAWAVLIDYAVITSSGLDFWQHYCVSPAYWCLVPAYFALWAGGAWLRSRRDAPAPRRVAELALAVVASVALCQLVSQGSFYWLSGTVAAPTLQGWWANYVQWLGPYLATTSGYVAIAAALRLAALRLRAPLAAR